MVRLLLFKDAVSAAKRKYETLSVLLGNGFSIDYDNALFCYESLANEAALDGLSVPKAELFDQLGTRDFESVIEKLRVAASLHELYGGSSGDADRMRHDAAVVRRGLADVLATRHPDTAFNLTDSEVLHARTFLSHFEHLYSLNYDLLLYWVSIRKGLGPSVSKTDGFAYPQPDDHSCLVWKSRLNRKPQRVHFLHGALHLFVSGNDLTKLRFKDHGSLVFELRKRLAAGEYPLLVTEGTRAEKEERIARSPYLSTAHRRFGATEGALFLHGFSLSPNDNHVLERIESRASDVTALYVGIHGAVDSRPAREVIARAQEIKRNRAQNEGRRLTVRFYSSSSAHVWRD